MADVLENAIWKLMLRKKTKKKSNFISSDSVLLLVCYLGRVFLHRNARNICVAICGGFAKNIANFTGLIVQNIRCVFFLIF